MDKTILMLGIGTVAAVGIVLALTPPKVTTTPQQQTDGYSQQNANSNPSMNSQVLTSPSQNNTSQIPNTLSNSSLMQANPHIVAQFSGQTYQANVSPGYPSQLPPLSSALYGYAPKFQVVSAYTDNVGPGFTHMLNFGGLPWIYTNIDPGATNVYANTWFDNNKLVSLSSPGPFYPHEGDIIAT